MSLKKLVGKYRQSVEERVNHVVKEFGKLLRNSRISSKAEDSRIKNDIDMSPFVCC